MAENKNQEVEVEENLDLPETKEGEEDTTDWKAEAQKLREKAIGQRERTKTLNAKIKELETKVPKAEPENKPAQSNEPDYGKMAYLHARGLQNPDDTKYVTKEAERLKLPLHEVLEMEHVKHTLQVNKDSREAQDGMPGGGNRGSGVGLGTVDHWLVKGGLPNDQVLAEKVVNARMTQEKTGNKFSDEMF